jgi:membrane-bound lytic murein transglycosylase D
MQTIRNLVIAISICCALSAAHAQEGLKPSPALMSMVTGDTVPSAVVTHSTSPSLASLSPTRVEDDLPTIPFVDLTVPPDDLWQRVRNGFAMQNLGGTLVTQRQAWYLNNPETLRRTLERSRRYLYHIVVELEKRGMPTEIALLPFVESSFNPLAYSPARAHGMWQFIPSTGKNYNLQQNWWLDQRRDIVASTNAALDYLQYIYDMHGDWHLALASYNWGEGAVGRAVAKNQRLGLPTDYASLKMPDETRYYVPALQALKNLIAEPQLFGLKLDPIPNLPFFGLVERDGPMDVALAARLAEIPVAEFVSLNPAYSRPQMPAVGNSFLLLPAEKVDTFRNNLLLHEAQDKPLSAWKIYALKKGEKLDAVAKRYQISGGQLRQLNGITKKTRIVPGMNLLVPGPDAVISHMELNMKLPQTPAAPPKAMKVRKKSGVAAGKRGKTTSVNKAKRSTANAKSRNKVTTSVKAKPVVRNRATTPR